MLNKVCHSSIKTHYLSRHGVSLTCLVFIPVVLLYDPTTGEGAGALDFLDREDLVRSKLTEDEIEKWWCLGDVRNRVAVWVQGNPLLQAGTTTG